MNARINSIVLVHAYENKYSATLEASIGDTQVKFTLSADEMEEVKRLAIAIFERRQTQLGNDIVLAQLAPALPAPKHTVDLDPNEIPF